MQRTEYESERELLLGALSEAMCDKFDTVVAESSESDSSTRAHKKRMARIVSGKKVLTRRKRRLLVLLVAAMTLLAACATGLIYREVSGHLIKEEYQNGDVYYCFEEIPCKDYSYAYRLTYMPESYYYLRSDVPRSAIYKSRKMRNEIHITTCTKYNVRYDAERYDAEVVEYKGYEIICISNKKNNLCDYIWYDGEASYVLIESRLLLEYEEIYKMLEGLERYEVKMPQDK
ncbi:MAG: hypothetical protein ACI3XL_01725 [Eubacteriales bacterium]